MPAAGREIFQLYQKIQALVETLFEAEKISSVSMKAFAEHCGMNVSTLKSCCATQRMSDKWIKGISAACKFDTGHPSWIDTNINLRNRGNDVIERADTANKFRKYVRGAWGLVSNYSVKIKPQVPQIHECELATFALDSGGQSFDSIESIPVFLTVDATTAIAEEGFSYGFEKLRVEIQLPDELEIIRLDIKEDFGRSNAALIRRGTDHSPYWLLEAVEGLLEGNFVTSEGPLFEIFNYSTGDFLEAKLTGNIRDGSLSRLDGESMPTPAKRAIIESLMAKSLDPDFQRRGELTLSKQRLQLVRTS